MKKLAKLITWILSISMIVGILSACGKNDSDPVATNDGSSFTYWAVMDGNSVKTLKNYNEMMFFQEMEKRTGVHIDFIHPIAGSTGNEAFITMLTGSERPDMIEYQWNQYSGGAQQALDDEVIISLNEYIKDYAPNYYDYMEGEKGKEAGYTYKLEATTDDGRYYGFNVLNVGETKGFTGLYTRADLLKKWGMEIPETIDEWTAVFAKAKSEGFSSPYTGTIGTLSFIGANTHTFNTAFGVGKGFYLEDGKVVFAPFEKGYKEYVAQLAEWTKAGYIDTGFITNDTQKIEGNMTNGVSMTTWGYVGSGIGKILPAAQAKDPSYDLVACPYPVSKKGEVSEFQQMYNSITDRAIGISSECGNYEKAIEWCDYRYGEEGMELMLFGIEGDTYTVEEINGEKHYIYTDKITDFKSQGLNSVADTLYKYMLPCNYPGYNQHIDYLNGYYQMQQQKDAIKTWNASVDKAEKHRLPAISYTIEENQEITDIKEIVEHELEVDICDIILGEKSIDTYDEIIKKAKTNGYGRWIEIIQDAYDRYIAKIDK